MSLDWLLDRFRGYGNDEAVVWRDQPITYRQLLERIESAQSFLVDQGLSAGEVVILDADFSPNAIALLLACVAQRLVVVPIAAHVANLDRDKYAEVSQAGTAIRVADDDTYAGCPTPFRGRGRMDAPPARVTHELLLKLRADNAPGLILFSSGSSGAPKAAVHNLDRLLKRFHKPRHAQRMITFLLFDHIGGFNTMMYTLSSGGCVITLDARDPVSVCRAIQNHRAEVLPTSPTFLNLLLMSEAYKEFDLSSLKLINYATEVMPPATLARLNEVFPTVTFHQSYGLSELGIMRTQSRSRDSTWLKVVGEGYRTRVVDGILHIDTEMSMMGYLNAPSPFTEDGWFNTNDEVEVDGEWMRIKGRKSDIINVGGEKVYPAEVESVMLEVPEVSDATVTKEPHPITGNIVVAEIIVKEGEEFAAVVRKLRAHCYARLPRYKVPVKFNPAGEGRVSDRFKKTR